MIRVLIVDDHPIVRIGFRKILEEDHGGFQIEEADTGCEAVEKVKAGDYDLVLLDISMPGMTGLEALENIRKLKRALPVLLLSISPEKEYALRALRSGASGYLTKKSAADELLSAIKKILDGGRYISPSLADLLACEAAGEFGKPLHECLTSREFCVMRSIAEGKPLKKIAGELSLSPKTISAHRKRLLLKLGLKSNAELVQYCLKNSLIEPEKMRREG